MLCPDCNYLSALTICHAHYIANKYLMTKTKLPIMNVRISVGFHCNDVKMIDTIDRETVRQ